jgi:tRNA pseudouridine13 synthase
MLRLSKGKRAKGKTKSAPEDFIVEEITKTGHILEKDRRYLPEELGVDATGIGKGQRFSVFILQKRDWNTASALREVAKKCGRGIKSASFAGSKDRTSISTQLCSMFGATPETLMNVHVKDIKINGAWPSESAVALGDLAGNRFTITITDPLETEFIPKIEKELGGIFPNYYGLQRFGSRSNNPSIGLSIIKGDFESAVRSFLMDYTGETNEEAVAARMRLSEEQDFSKAQSYFPRYLKYERLLLESLAKNPTDYANAIRRLPRAITLMFVHSVESDIFNNVLEARVRDHRTKPEKGDMVCATDGMGFPNLSKTSICDGSSVSGTFALGNLIGYNSKDLSNEEKGILENLGITKEDFKVKHMPELNCKGAVRPLFSTYTGFALSGSTLSFSLPAGSYATVLLDEFLEHAEIIPE